jgi:hypothetical protein
MATKHPGGHWWGAAAVALCVTGMARAEFTFSFSLGAAFTQPSTVEVEEDSISFPATTTFEENTTFDTAVAVDFRFTYWVDPAPFVGVAFDFSYFRAESDTFEWNSITPFSCLAMLRAPLLRSRQYRFGQLQPYLGVGPSAIFAATEIDLSPKAGVKVDGYSADIGLDVRAGIEVLVHPQVGIFAEYRLLYWVQHLEDDSEYYYDDGEDEDEAETELLTHFAMLGVSFHF